MQGSVGDKSAWRAEAEQIIAAHDGDVALLWLCLRLDPSCGLEDAARALCRTRAEMEAAHEKLCRMGLAEAAEREAPPEKRPASASVRAPKLQPAEELPEYTARDLAVRSREDPRFAALVTEAQRALGRILSTSDLKKLFGLYDYLALPPEVIMMLLNYCVTGASTGNPPSMRQIEKEGYVWANREILTLEQAEEYIASSQRRREKLSQLAALLGIKGRALSPTENKFLSSWLEMGFDDELIEMAYDRTLTNTGGLKWSYMNGILKSWHEKGLHTPADVRDKDTRRGKPDAGNSPQNLDKLMANLDRI